MFATDPISLCHLYSFDEAVHDGIAAEVTSSHRDLGPIDSMDPATLKRECDAFFGPSHQNLPSPGPEPKAQSCLLDELIGISPLSTPPQTPYSSRSASPALVTHVSSPAIPLPPTQGTQVNSKTRRNRKKGRAKRTLKRKAERENEDKNATPHPRSLKRLKMAERTETSYDTRDIPSASTGFVARRDTDSGRVARTETLLRDPSFQLIKHQEGCVALPTGLNLAPT